jgi:OmpA family.
VYRRADIPKPRNLLGLTKDLPVPEMEALLLAHLPASEDLAHEVAMHRAQAVVRYLRAHQLPAERLFVNAPKVSTTPEEGWVPRAELGLAMR